MPSAFSKGLWREHHPYRLPWEGRPRHLGHSAHSRVPGWGQERGRPQQLGRPGLGCALVLWGPWAWDLSPRVCSQGVQSAGTESTSALGTVPWAGAGECGENVWGRGVAIQPGSPSQGPPGPPPAPGSLPAVVSWSSWELRSAGGQWREPDGGADGRPRGAPEDWGWPGRPGSRKGHRECSAAASCQQASNNVVSI